MGFKKILFVEDDSVTRRLFSTYLNMVGVKKEDILEASDGIMAVEVYKEHKSDIGLVVLDLSLPHKSGDEVLKDIKGINQDVTVIITSCYEKWKTYTGDLLAADDYIDKTKLNLSKLKDLLDEYYF